MTIFDEYPKYAGKCQVSPTLLWEYDLSHFDWYKSRRLVVQRVIERGDLMDYYAAINMYGGMDNFREIIKEVSHLSKLDINFVCTVFQLKKEDLRCYTRMLLREKLFLS